MVPDTLLKDEGILPYVLFRKIHVVNEVLIEVVAIGKLDMLHEVDNVFCHLPVLLG